MVLERVGKVAGDLFDNVTEVFDLTADAAGHVADGLSHVSKGVDGARRMVGGNGLLTRADGAAKWLGAGVEATKAFGKAGKALNKVKNIGRGE